ncbi:MAG: TolC family protein [Planctomycetes bacterium]|nr:TolC family protein [Planctomycetota bacterium]
MNRTLLNCRCALAAMLLPCLTGCLDLLKRDYYGDYRRPPQRLHEIETLRLEDRSRTAPVTIEQAATNAVEELATAAQPPESIDLTLAEVRTAALANNLGLKVEFVNPSVAEQSIGVEEARFEALLFGSVSQNETDRPPAVKDGLGAAPQIEIMRAESGVARRLEAIIITDTGVKFRERDLKRIMNRDDLPIESPTALRPMTEPNPLGLDLDAPAMADYAVANRMEMLELEIQLAIDASAIDFEKNGALPLFVLDYSYTINGFSGSFNAAFRDLGRNAYVDHAVTLRAEIPLGNQAAKSRVRRAVLERAQRLATREQRRLAIRQEVFDALDSLQQDWQRILAARRDVVLAGRTYEAEKKQFEVGLRTSTDVLEAAAFLADAQSREIRALSAYEISQVDIAFAAGALVGKDRVIWEPAGIE